MSWLLQISDCHLVAPGERLLGVDTQASLEAVLTQALAEHTPAAIVASGDLAVTGRYLQQCRQPHTLVATHHPWLDIDTPWLDKDRIQTPTDLLNWLAARAPDLRGVIFGHAHQEISGQCLQTPLYGVPSTCFQFQPGSQRFSIADAAPGYRWLQLADDGRMATHVGRLANYALNLQLP